uniref:Protection of telomeres protein 1 n=1 Tax=Mesocestoides corti TaxID=53468 RepID=A0A5K3F299_MESCO
MAAQYTFTDLRNINVGCHNVIAVVKFFKKPQKTKGTGYSMFASVSDPSLCGDKFPVIFLCNNIDHLPPIRTPGDIIIMHRLKVSMYRGSLQGCGPGSSGFAFAVFPGLCDSPLTPYPSPTNCSFTDADLFRVFELRGWYNSDSCPLEKELPPDVVMTEPQAPSNQMVPFAERVVPSTRIHSIMKNAFVNIEAQIVAIYSYPPEITRDIILSLWDGQPPPEAASLPPFYTHHDLDRPPHISDSRTDPHLAAITGHSMLPANEDWSVTVFVFDEHAQSAVAKKLKPGDLIRIINVHCTGKLGHVRRKLDVHGGGQKYGRRIELLTEETAPPDLVARLKAGRDARKPITTPSQSPGAADLGVVRCLSSFFAV